MKQRIIYTSLALLLAGNSAIAQCDLEKITDDFTGKKTVLSRKIKIAQGGTPILLKARFSSDCRYKIYLRFIQSDTTLYISMSEDADNCRCTVTELSFKFRDGKAIIKSECTQGIDTKSGLGTEQRMLFPITKADLGKFSTSEIVKFRIAEGGCADHPITEDEMEDKIATMIKNNATCMLLNTAK